MLSCAHAPLIVPPLVCSAPQTLPEPVVSAHSSGAESESSASDSSSDSESESSSSDSEENDDDDEPLETPAPEVARPFQKAVQDGSWVGVRAAH